jgi:hypothetical protein
VIDSVTCDCDTDRLSALLFAGKLGKNFKKAMPGCGKKIL